MIILGFCIVGYCILKGLNKEDSTAYSLLKWFIILDCIFRIIGIGLLLGTGSNIIEQIPFNF